MSKNDITGDTIITKASTKEYKQGWDRIYQAQYTETLQDTPESPTIDLNTSEGQCITYEE